MQIKKVYTVGNRDILGFPKIAFLCSRQIPAAAVLKCYDWAIEQREKEMCVISGFQSQIEKDVLHYLLQGKQPVIIALARGLKERIEPELKDARSQNRLLIVTSFTAAAKRPSAETAVKRNRMMVEMANEGVFGYIKEGGALAKLKSEYEGKKKMTLL